MKFPAKDKVGHSPTQWVPQLHSSKILTGMSHKFLDDKLSIRGQKPSIRQHQDLRETF